MSSLLLMVNGRERRLPEQDAHYLWIDSGTLRASANPPSRDACFGHLVSEFGQWWFHSGPAQCPRELRINGQPVDGSDIELGADRAEVRLTGDPYSDPGPSGPRRTGPRTQPVTGPDPAPTTGGQPHAVRQLVIGPVGTDATITIDDPSVLPNHAVVEIDRHGAWWVTAVNGEVYVDGEPVSSVKRDPGTRFTIGGHVLSVPDGSRRGRALHVRCDGVTVRRGGRSLLDNVSLTIAAAEFVAVVSPDDASTEMLLGLIVGGYEPDRGTIRVGGSSSRENPLVRWVPATEELYGTLSAQEMLEFTVAADPSGEDPAESRLFVDEVLSWVGLEGKGQLWARTLNDAERKRLSIALEVVARPGLLVVFESDTGCEISRDRDLMSRLRTIGRDTRCTVIVAARSVGHLDTADVVVVLDRQGRVRYAGPPGQRMANQPDLTWAEWIAGLDVPDGEQALARSTVATRLPPMAATSAPESTFAGLRAVLRRQVVLCWRRGRGALAILPVLPVLGTVLVVLLTDSRPALLTVAVLSALAVGRVDLVTERPALGRDRRRGISVASLVTAKLTVHGGLCGVLVLPMATVADIAHSRLPRVPGLSPWLSEYLTLWLVTLVALAAGMLGCAAVRRSDSEVRNLQAGVVADVAAAVGALVVAGVLVGLGWFAALAGLLAAVVVVTGLAGGVLRDRLTSGAP